MKDLEALDHQLGRIAALLRIEPDATGLRAEKISRWSVGEQLDHALQVIEASLARLGGQLENQPRGINLVGRTLLAIGRLPRGVASSPKALRARVRPRAELAERAESVRARLRSLGAQADLWRIRRPVFPHPFFGGLTPLQGLRMLAVHTDHHLRIVADIQRACGR
jgi:hypothetical protein